MGAGGCLGPKKTKDEIYAKLITEMHEQAHKISHPDTKNLDMYQLIKQKITKKGYLRKFIDNLSSHRHKIIDSFNLNYKLTVQTKEVQKHYAGLIVADSLIQMVSSTFALEEKSDDTQFRQQRDSYAQSMVKSASKVAQGDTTKHLRKMITEKRVDIYEQHNNFYDQLYLRIVWYLFQNEKKMQYRLLQSLILFCNKHLGIIGCQHFVWKIIDKLNKNIQNNLFLAESCCLFNLLLQRTRDEAGEQLRNEQVLAMIIRTWLQQKESLEVESGEIQQDCQQIICAYFHRCISLWYSEFLYQVIFVFYDSISFSKIEQGLLEKLIQKILEHLDLKSHFFRGLFNYLLAYLSVTPQSLNSEQDKKLFSTCLGISSQKFRSHYKNIFKDHIKLQGFKLLNNWVTKKYTDINQFCMYNNQSLILVYLSNSKYYYKNKMMLDAIIDEYFKIITKLDLGNRRLFVQRLEQAFRQQKYSKIQQELMLRLLKQCVHRNIFPEQSSTHTSMYLYLTPISSKYSSDLKQQLLKLTGYLFESSSVSSQKINEQQKYKICQFLFSIYENINIAIESIEQKYQFVCASLSVIRIVYQRFKQNVLVLPIVHILIAYMHKLGKQILVLLESKGYKVYNAYMAVYLYEEILFILDVDKQRNKKVREQIIEINNNICLDLDEIGTNTQTEKRNILQLNVQQFLASIKTEYPEFLSFSFTLSKEIEEQYRAIFTRVFSSSTLPNQSNNKFQMGRKTSRDSGSFSAYSRTSQMMKNCQKCRGNDNIQCKCRQMKKNWRASDYSFQEVIDIVHV